MEPVGADSVTKRLQTLRWWKSISTGIQHAENVFFIQNVFTSIPPGQNVHLPCGHANGFGIIAITATPEAVLTGFFSRIF